MNEQLLTIAEAAERLHCSTRTVWRRINSGELAAFRDRRLVRIRPGDLDTYTARRTNSQVQAATSAHRGRPTRGPRAEVRSLFDLPDPLVDPPSDIDLSSDETRKCPGGAPTPRGRQQGGTP